MTNTSAILQLWAPYFEKTQPLPVVVSTFGPPGTGQTTAVRLLSVRAKQLLQQKSVEFSGGFLAHIADAHYLHLDYYHTGGLYLIF